MIVFLTLGLSLTEKASKSAWGATFGAVRDVPGRRRDGTLYGAVCISRSVKGVSRSVLAFGEPPGRAGDQADDGDGGEHHGCGQNGEQG